ncbi:serine acetyltransferase [Parvularcula bermudensis HTCC2503]|uniref:Serine acetyltransferase n=1 Tax=Parvularcula bermudensis (strain ATCC BAA-594 / HTCC2503 / KCTC 12087) TaxID=314260 RepID=E0TBU0_PARBH|nr:serine O-acetyltransferase [Parvularcula bermudensis]ADM08433.1 serine acetyltransferase [Parvularcula bermudensis HTCC2503]
MAPHPHPPVPATLYTIDRNTVWSRMRLEAATAAAQEPAIASFLNASLLHHDTIEAALSYRLAEKLSDGEMKAMLWREVAMDAYQDKPQIVAAALSDLLAYFDRDPACRQYSHPFLYLKGFHALQSYRIANWLWGQGREALAHYLQSRISELYNIDIHPAARLGESLFFDHASGIVIGETAVIADEVSVLHNVTLGGTGKETGDRHPKIGRGVLISAGAKILGNIEVGEGAKIAAGSVVLHSVKPFCTVAGVPAVPVGACAKAAGGEMDQHI